MPASAELSGWSRPPSFLIGSRVMLRRISMLFRSGIQFSRMSVARRRSLRRRAFVTGRLANIDALEDRMLLSATVADHDHGLTEFLDSDFQPGSITLTQPGRLLSSPGPGDPFLTPSPRPWRGFRSTGATSPRKASSTRIVATSTGRYRARDAQAASPILRSSISCTRC